MKLKGIGASSGIAIAKVFELLETNIKIEKTKVIPDKEIINFDKAIAETITQIKVVKDNALKNLGSKEAAVFDAHIQVATDPAMVEEIKKEIRENQVNAIFATDKVTKKYILMFENMDDAYMKERAADIKDVAKRIINVLAGVKSVNVSTINSKVIIVANDLTPSDTAQLNKKFVKGFITNIGGKTSHAAIMARSLEIPAVLGLNKVTKQVKNGDVIAMDGDTGEVLVNPTKDELIEFEKKAKMLEIIANKAAKFRGKKSLTKDGREIEIAANIGSPSDVPAVIENDGEAIGLFRSEFLYMDAKDWPTEDEQFESYKAVLVGMKEKKVVVRTLDIGGDKTLEYFKFPEEMNPFLGYRAIRLSLDKKDIFKTQLRALLRASAFGTLAIMFPMIATINEFKAAKSVFEDVKKDLHSEGVKFSNSIEVGMMVEIPGAAIIAKQFAKYADFFSIGTNDLMQYTMAADRMNEKVAYLYQPLNPSILNLIKLTINGAHSNGKWVGMCGEMAGDSQAIPILVGLGIDELSMSATSVLKSRMQLASIDFKKAQELATIALEQDTNLDVKKLVNQFNAS